MKPCPTAFSPGSLATNAQRAYQLLPEPPPPEEPPLLEEELSLLEEELSDDE